MEPNQQLSIKKFGKQELALLRLEIQTALDVIKNKYELSKLNLEGITFNEFSFTSKIAGKITGETTEVYNIYEARFFASLNGLPENLLNSHFISNGRSHTIIRIETRNRKYPIITQCADDGKIYKFTVQLIKEILERTQVPPLQQLHKS